jgi:membrane protein DedA with SNARE-associated domain
MALPSLIGSEGMKLKLWLYMYGFSGLLWGGLFIMLALPSWLAGNSLSDNFVRRYVLGYLFVTTVCAIIAHIMIKIREGKKGRR